MNLWIRSQDKEDLSIIKSLCVANHGGKDLIMGWSETTFDIVLGKYSTRERCLEIIDEIQSAISFAKDVCIPDDKGGFRFVYENGVNSVFYIMPKE